MEWGDTLRTAGGDKTGESVQNIKKQMKRKEKKKAKSTKAWKDRIETVADKMMEKQNIRKHNLKERQKGGSDGANLSKKRIVGADAEGEEGGPEKKKRKREGPYSKIGREDEDPQGKHDKKGNTTNGGGSNGRAGFEGKKGNFINGKGKSTSSGGAKKAKGQ